MGSSGDLYGVDCLGITRFDTSGQLLASVGSAWCGWGLALADGEMYSTTTTAPASNVFRFVWNDGPVGPFLQVRWGDPNRGGGITAVDALICLASTVGKDITRLTADSCDVAPDDGTAFTGRVSALDSLVILAYSVGRELSERYWVGRTR